MKGFLNQLFDYNFYCNKKLIEACTKLPGVPERSVLLINHILNAHHIWNNRILEQKIDFKTFQIHPITDWEDIHYENQRASFDIINHSTYHRGQIATDFRDHGIEPLKLDYTLYKR